MHFDEYQVAAARTLTRTPDADKQLAVMGLGLAGEAGEVIEMIKKAVGHGHVLDGEKLEEEIADCLWYLAALATLAGISLDAAAEKNISKLKRRYPDGFSHAASRERK